MSMYNVCMHIQKMTFCMLIAHRACNIKFRSCPKKNYLPILVVQPILLKCMSCLYVFYLHLFERLDHHLVRTMPTTNECMLLELYANNMENLILLQISISIALKLIYETSSPNRSINVSLTNTLNYTNMHLSLWQCI